MTIVISKQGNQSKKPTDGTHMTSTTSALFKRGRPTGRSKNNKLLKYYVQRYQLFSRFDDGIELDDEAWWSVTPEKIACHIASRFQKTLGEGHVTIVDAFCGVGGNLIQFALYSPHVRVIGIDVNLDRLRMARNNAKIYGVQHQCDFILGDFMLIARSLQSRCVDAVFCSPPWGGVDYNKTAKYSLDQMTPNGYEIVELCRKYLTNNIAFLMPRNTDLDEVNRKLLTKEYPESECEQNMVGAKVKTLTMYFGDLVDQTVEAVLQSEPMVSSTGSDSSQPMEEDEESG